MFIPKDFMGTYMKLMAYSGLKPPTAKKSRFFYFLIFIPLFLALGVSQNAATIIQIFLTIDQFRVTMFNIGMQVPLLCSTIRYVYYYAHIGNFEKIVKILRRKSFNFEGFFDVKKQSGQR